MNSDGFPCIYGLFVTFLWTVRMGASEEDVKVSDACHGAPHIRKATNYLRCGPGMQIKITEVLLYQARDLDVGCPSVLSSDDVLMKCCVHDVSRCSWNGTGENSVARLQAQCKGRELCDLNSPKSERIGGTCKVAISRTSNVRSIKYVCVRKVFISDACHGRQNLEKANNDLRCGPGERVNITEVRLYQAQNSDTECPGVLSSNNVPSRCCVHDDLRCSWNGKGENSVASLQAQCEEKQRCDLNSADQKRVEEICEPTTGQFSNVRSIRYVCIKTEATSVSTSLPITLARPTARIQQSTADVSPTGDEGEPVQPTTLTTAPATSSTTLPASSAAGITVPNTQHTPDKENRLPPQTNKPTETSNSGQEEASTAKGNNSVAQATVTERFSPSTVGRSTERMYSSADEDSGVHIGLIVGASLGGLAMICVTVIVLVIYVKRSGHPDKKQPVVNGHTNRTSASNPNYFDVVYSEASDSNNIYSEDKYSLDQTGENGEFGAYSNIYDNDGDVYAELSDFGEPPARENSQGYDHIVGELPASFPLRHASDYDLVASDKGDQDSNYASGNENDSGPYFQVKRTYDSLQHKTDLPTSGETLNKEVGNSYNTLDRLAVISTGRLNFTR